MADDLRTSEIDRELLEQFSDEEECSDASYFTPPKNDSGPETDETDDDDFPPNFGEYSLVLNTSEQTENNEENNFMGLDCESLVVSVEEVISQDSLENPDIPVEICTVALQDQSDQEQIQDHIVSEDNGADFSVVQGIAKVQDPKQIGTGQHDLQKPRRRSGQRVARKKKPLEIDLSWDNFSGLQKKFNFNRNPTININLPNDSPPVDYYNQFVNEELINLMVVETNRNAQQTLSSRRFSRSSRLRLWTDTDVVEMKKFLGLLIWMGLASFPRISDYWSKSMLYKNSVASTVMSRNRFQLLLRFWHFSDNQNPGENGRLEKIAPLISSLNATFKNLKTAEEELAIDESMVPFRGRLIFRQYLPKKAHKYGVKLFKLCDSTGYTYTIKVYSGKGSNITPDLLMGTSVVLELCEPYLNSGSTIYVDNYYNSIELANLLLKKETHLVGTLRKDRVGLPSNLIFNKELKRGEMVVAENKDGIVVTNWMDKRPVLMLSTKHAMDMVETGKKDRKGNVIMKPLVVSKYNDLKMGIDIADQMSSYNSAVRKTLRWYHKVAEHALFGSAMVNSWLAYKKNLNLRAKPMSITSFKESVCLELMGLSNEEPQPTIRLTGHHYLKESDIFIGLGKNRRRQRKVCTVCYKKASVEEKKKSKNMTKVTTFCAKCTGQPYMCKMCFETIHK